MPKIIYKEREIKTSQLYFRKAKLKNLKVPSEDAGLEKALSIDQKAHLWTDLSMHSASFIDQPRELERELKKKPT